MLQLEASRTAPTSRPSPIPDVTTFPSDPSSRYGGRRWVNSGPPPKLADLPEEKFKGAAYFAGISDADFPEWLLQYRKKLAEKDAKMSPPIGVCTPFRYETLRLKCLASHISDET